ncbi:MAG: divalent-cation tolerance protein CutA [Verrucomicrobia bacterium]|nr:divalent-cation tolerance protein CutA [Verrucomicrobiota bacterium]MCH8512275.1 divalent-cation tolerance protein CutA [Kiritimatiellia bacterium]
MNDVQLFYIPVPDTSTGKKLARSALSAKLAACANLLPAGTSLYEWKGELCEASEQVLLLKTLPAKADALEALMLSEHPYDCPCVLRLAPAQANDAFFQWMMGEVLSAE